MADSTEETKEWVLDPETEYRFELDPDTTLAIKIIRGSAEVFGAELSEGVTHLFGSECKAAVYTWQGCTLQIRPTSPSPFSYALNDIPFSTLQAGVDGMRVRALQSTYDDPVHADEVAGVPDGPPRVLVLGPENAGKTTACKILMNYAVRTGQGWTLMFVSVDPSEGGWTVPGTVSACPMKMPIPTQSPANPLGSTVTSAPTALSSGALLPLVYWYGHAEVRQNPLLMDRLIRNLGENVNSRHLGDSLGNCSGVIIDTPSSFATGIAAAPSDKKYALVKACVDAFQINVILIIGHEKLNVEMQRIFGASMSVVKVPKSGGVVDLDHAYRERVHGYQIHHYMYGTHFSPPPGLVAAGTSGDESVDASDARLSPVSTAVGFDDLAIYRIGGESIAPSSALPIGATRAVSELQPVQVDPGARGSGLLNAVLALLAPLHPDENERYDEEVLDLAVSAFLVVTAVDMSNRKLTILMPGPGPVAGRTAIVGSFEWQDQ